MASCPQGLSGFSRQFRGERARADTGTVRFENSDDLSDAGRGHPKPVQAPAAVVVELVTNG